jgi:outer membrane immunogenic protein
MGLLVTTGNIMRRIKLALLAATSLVALGSIASAADLRAPMYRPAPVAFFSWTGCYAGGHVGYARSNYDQQLTFDDVNTNPEFIFTNHLSPDGVAGGVQGGCNYQMGNIVYGLEGDYTWTDRTDSRAFAFATAGDVDSAAFSAKTQSLWSVRGRVGVAHDRALVYLTAGYGGANFKYNYALNDNGAVSAAALSFDTDGVVFGGGLEYAWTNYFIVRAEYLHYAFGQEKQLAPVAVIGPAVQDYINLKSVDVIRVGASYKFW